MTANRIGAPRLSLRSLLLAGTVLGGASASYITSAHTAGQGSPPFVFEPGTLVISSTTYDNTQGAIASLVKDVTHIGQNGPVASAGNDYVHVWDNDSVDSNFGVTSAIELSDVDPVTGRVRHRGIVPTDQVVTSFSSKSEGSIHIAQAWPNARLVFVGYASAGVGALDVSNSDAVPGQDPTNPVTMNFGNTYAFQRTIVAIDIEGNIAYTPTIAYGGDNGRGGLQGSNGLYYTVGNSNNGNASTFGSASNGTNPDVTETTGLEVVDPIDAMFVPPVAEIPANNSAEIDPLFQFTFSGKKDKPGKDDNFRGITEFGGALYFSKGSGSNGEQSVYTVTSQPPLPTVAEGSAATIHTVPGFPTDQAKAKLGDNSTGGNFTPFGIFFADATTMYVADEGTGNSTDATTNAGLEKWSLGQDGVTWQLDYVLQKGLIGIKDTNLTGPDGQYPDVTTVGLRNLTGFVGADGKVTLWAATATTSTSGDPGADPNKIVTITDDLGATTMTPDVASETFHTFVGPTYGTVYRGVAFVDKPVGAADKLH